MTAIDQHAVTVDEDAQAQQGSETEPAGRLRWPRTARRAAIELSVIGALYVLYRMARLALNGQEDRAIDNAGVLRRLESWLHLPSEAALQAFVAPIPNVFELANSYYVYLHFPVMIAFLVWGFAMRPAAQYSWARNLLVIQTFLGLVLHFLIPLAPPRMFPGWGFTDTMTQYGPSAYEGASAAVANQFAAMPSLHIGWAVLIAFVITRTAGPRLTALAWLHAAITVAVVVVTANHWWLDGVVAVGLLVIANALVPAPRTAPAPAQADER